jgi:4-amino-4-deoxy-L-arabinose transferase-like glycosyltransferase
MGDAPSSLHPSAGDRTARSWADARLWLILLLLVAAALRFLSCFRYLHVDERMVIENVLKFVKEHTFVPAHYQYPTFFSYLAAAPTVLWCLLLYATGRYSSPSDVMAMRYLDATVAFLPLRFTSLAFGVATIWLVCRLGRRFYDAKTGLIAAVLMTFSCVHIERSALGLPDAATAFFATCAFYVILSLSEDGRTRRWIAAGVLIGLATACKYNVAVMACSVIMAHALRLRAAGRLGCPRQWLTRDLVLCLAAVVVTFFVASPSWLVETRQFIDTFRLQGLHSKQGVIGVYKTPYWGWLVQAWGRESFIVVVFLAGLVCSLVRRRKDDLVLAAGVVPAILLIGAFRYGGVHYFLFVYPALAILAARLLVDLFGSLADRPVSRGVAGVAIGLCAVVPAFHAVDYALRSVLVDDGRVLAQRWINANIPAGATIAVDPVDVPKLLTEGRSGLLEGERADLFRRLLKSWRSYKVVTMPYETASPRQVPADYLVLSSSWYARFDAPPPGVGSPFRAAHLAAQSFYAALFSPGSKADWTLRRVFDTGNGPRILIYERMRTTTRPTSRSEG